MSGVLISVAEAPFISELPLLVMTFHAKWMRFLVQSATSGQRGPRGGYGVVSARKEAQARVPSFAPARSKAVKPGHLCVDFEAARFPGRAQASFHQHVIT